MQFVAVGMWGCPKTIFRRITEAFQIISLLYFQLIESQLGLYADSTFDRTEIIAAYHKLAGTPRIG